MKTSALVIGGGIVGLTSACELAERGHAVTLIDKGNLGFGCSYGNAGWITPCFAMPLPMPGMFWKSFKWLLDPESPLRIQPNLHPQVWSWLTQFLLSMNETKMKKSVAVLTEVSKYSLRKYQELHQRGLHPFGFQKKGLLLVAQSDEGLNAGIQELELVQAHGITGQILTSSQTKDFEPSLTGTVKGSVYFPEEAHAEPFQVIEAYKELATRLGVRILTQAEAYEFEVAQGFIQRVRTTKGDFKPELTVLCSGIWSRQLAKQLRLRIPLLGGKGYSMILPPLTKQPQHPLMLIEKKIAITPRNGSLRIAGTLELVRQDDSISPRRVRAILKGAREFLTLPEEPVIQEVWRGLRPCTPDGVPMIGFSKKIKNLFLLTGHQMLGLQSAPGTARLAAELIEGQSPFVDPAPFDPNRF